MTARWRACLVLAAACAWRAATASAQDFRAPQPPGPGVSPLAWIEDGCVGAAAGLTLEGAATRWLGAPELVTRAVALGGGWRAARGALGLSQTGDPEIGWTALGASLGVATREGGAALRVVARRDRHPSPESGPLGAGVGLEAGGGAWIAAGGGVTVWASVPQAWSRGAAPPLARGLEAGARYAAQAIAVWVARESAAPGSAGGHVAGVALGDGPLAVWLAARDRPLRAAVGLRATRGPLTASAEIESHPVLGETARLALGLATRRGGP